MAEGRSPGSRPAARNPVFLALVGLICIALGVALVRWESFLFGPSEPPLVVTGPPEAPSPAPPSAALPPARTARSGPAAPRVAISRNTAALPLARSTQSPPGARPAETTANPAAAPLARMTGNAPAASAAPGTPGTPAAPLADTSPSAHTAPAVPATLQRPTLQRPTLQQHSGPSFDVVRVDPSGNTVIAGRAPAGSTVTVTAGGTVVGTTRSDPDGQWVLAPDKPLPPGGRTLALSASLPNGTTVAGSEKVVVVVSHQNAAPPVALLDSPVRPRLIEAPPPASGGVGTFSLDLIQYGTQGSVSLAGRAPPGTELRIYLDNHLLGDVRADASGHWSLALDRQVAPGMHQVRLDRISPAGKVLARLAVPFDRAALPVAPGASEITVVQPGQCLWLIAQHVYGNGLRFTLIFQANRSQIRNPNLIYPGQVFTLPAPASAAGAHG